MHLQQDAALLVAVAGIAAVSGGLVVDPGLQVVADRADPHPDPLAILRPELRRARALHPQRVDAAGGIVVVAMVELRLVARRELLLLVEVRSAAEIDSAVAASAPGIGDPGLGVELEIVEVLERGEVALAPVAGENTIDDLPLGLVLVLVHPPAGNITAVEEPDPAIVVHLTETDVPEGGGIAMVLQADEAAVAFEPGNLLAVGLRELGEIGVNDLFAVDPDPAFFPDAENAHRLPLAGGPGDTPRRRLDGIDRAGELVGPEVLPFPAVIIQQLDLHAIDIGSPRLRSADENPAVSILRKLVFKREIKIAVLSGCRQPLGALSPGAGQDAILDTPVFRVTLHPLPAA